MKQPVGPYNSHLKANNSKSQARPGKPRRKIELDKKISSKQDLLFKESLTDRDYKDYMNKKRKNNFVSKNRKTQRS